MDGAYCSSFILTGGPIAQIAAFREEYENAAVVEVHEYGD